MVLREASVLRRHQLGLFFVLTFAISWSIWIPMALASLGIRTTAGAILNVVAAAGPSLAAVVLAIALGGGQLRELLGRFSVSRLSVQWSLVALALPLAMIALAIAISVALFGAHRPGVSVAVAAVLGAQFVRVLFLGGPIGEELGWRGFALPQLQARRAAFDVSVLLGVIWGIWHVPLYFVPGTGQYETLSAGADPAFTIGGFVVWTIGLSVLFTWLFNQSCGSLLVVVLFHTSVDIGSLLPSVVGSAGAALYLYVLLTWIVAIVVVVRFGRATLASVSPDRLG